MNTTCGIAKGPASVISRVLRRIWLSSKVSQPFPAGRYMQKVALTIRTHKPDTLRACTVCMCSVSPPEIFKVDLSLLLLLLCKLDGLCRGESMRSSARHLSLSCLHEMTLGHVCTQGHLKRGIRDRCQWLLTACMCKYMLYIGNEAIEPYPVALSSSSQSPPLPSVSWPAGRPHAVAAGRQMPHAVEERPPQTMYSFLCAHTDIVD